MSGGAYTGLKVFLSSTAQDLETHRTRVAMAVESMGLLNVRMETFGARTKSAVEECRKLASHADVVVVMVAHRYGWVPTRDEGGDGSKSITWIEVDAAIEAEVDILAFLVEPHFQWLGRREQDDLETALDEASAMLVYQRVRDLSKFKQFLEHQYVRAQFTEPGDLASKVATSLHNWLGERGAPASTRLILGRNNLPPNVDLIGRQSEKAEILEALATRAPVVLIDGIGGIGKTALALSVAHTCLEASRSPAVSDHLPNFTSFVWMSAKDRALRFDDILDTVARTLGVPDLTHRSVEDKEASVRDLLAEAPCLLIIDNFEVIEDERVRQFLSITPEPSKTLITSRRQDLAEARIISLGELTRGSAIELIRREANRLGLKSLEAVDQAKLDPLIDLAGGTPLAIRWAVGQIKQRGQSLDKVVAALRDAKGDLFPKIFDRSWSLLNDRTRRALILMPIFGAPFLREPIQTASSLTDAELDDALGQLVTMRLVDVTDELEDEHRRFSIHPLTRAFANSHLQEVPELERQGRTRVIEWSIKWTQRRGDKFAWLAR
jgi:Domain of unknown function (DUF4062)/NB-ARC domain